MTSESNAEFNTTLVCQLYLCFDLVYILSTALGAQLLLVSAEFTSTSYYRQL
jgi:hypothetical protein